MNFFTPFSQLLLLCSLAQLADVLLPMQIPSTLYAMFFVFIALKVHWLKEERFSDIATFFQRNLAFFFLPPLVKVLSVWEVIAPVWVTFLAACILSAVLTFMATAYTVSFICHLQQKHAQRRGTKG